MYVSYNTTPHHTTPHHITLHHITPHHTTLHYTTPHHTTPHHITPHHTTPCLAMSCQINSTRLRHSYWTISLSSVFISTYLAVRSGRRNDGQPLLLIILLLLHIRYNLFFFNNFFVNVPFIIPICIADYPFDLYFFIFLLMYIYVCMHYSII